MKYSGTTNYLKMINGDFMINCVIDNGEEGIL